MSTTTAIIVLVVVLVLLALGALALVARSRQARRRQGLQDRFGPEYDRAVEAHGDRRSAEKRLADAADRRDQIEVRSLQPAERERYEREWTDVQATFVDAPAPATRDADRLVQAVMRERGYPVDDFATRAEMLATDHPEVVEHYRAAHDVGSRTDGADTESLRQAFVHYRKLFDLLLHDGQQVRGTTGTAEAGGTTGTGQAEPVDLRGDQVRRTS